MIKRATLILVPSQEERRSFAKLTAKTSIQDSHAELATSLRLLHSIILWSRCAACLDFKAGQPR